MKKISLLLVLITITVFGQNRSRPVQNNIKINNVENNTIESVPRRISYQGLITKADGSPTEDGSYEVIFRVYNSVDGVDPIWEEAQEVNVINGIISTVLGNTNPFTTIPQEAFLELSVEGSTLSPRQLLTSVFYSILSDTSGYAKTANYDNLINLPDLDVYVMKDSLESYTTSAELYDTLAVYQQLDSNLTDLTEDGVLSGSKVEYGITSPGTNGQSWISDGDGSGEWGIPTALVADGIISVGSLTLDSGTITDDSGAISFGDENISTTGTLSAEAGSSLGNITLGDGTITAGGNISFGDEDLSTTGTLSAGAGSSLGNITLGDGTITAGGNISFGDEDLSTTGTLSAGVTTLGAGSEIGDLTLSDGSITSSSDTISFGNDAISTLGTLSSGTATLATGSTIGNLTLADGSITDADGSISFGDNDVSTSGSISSGRAILGSNTTIGNLTLADGYIVDSGGLISFGEVNISTTGTLNSGRATLATGSTVGNLTIADGSITDAGGSISFGDENLTTVGTITANSFSGDGSNLTGVEATSTGTLSGATPIVLEGETNDDFETTIALEDPTADRTITFPDTTGIVLTTGNESTIDQVGTIASGTWQGTAVADTYIADDLTISGGTINNTIIGGTAPVAGTFTTLTGSSADVGTVSISDGLITDSGGTISFDNENLSTSGTLATGAQTVTGNVTASDTVSAEQLTSTDDLTVADQASIDGTLTLATGSITDSDGAIDFGNENLSTSGTLASGAQTVTGNVTASDTVSAEQLTSTDDLTVADQASIDGTLTLATGSITDSDGAIDFGNENLSTSGTLASGAQTVTGNVTASDTVSAEQLTSTDDLTVADQASIDGTLTLATGSITDSDGAISFDNENLSTSGTLATGAQTVTGNVTASDTVSAEQLTSTDDLTVADQASIDGTLTLATGSITDSDGAISFGDENLTTSGTLASGAQTVTGNVTASATVSAEQLTSTDDLTIGDDLNLASDAAVLSLGEDGDVTLTHVPDVGILLGDTRQMQFRDNALKISSTIDGQLDIDADTEVEITANTVDLNGALDVSENVIVGESLQTATIDYIDGDLAITISDGGAVTTSGDLTVGGTISGGNITASSMAADDIVAGDGAVSISTSSGAITLTSAAALNLNPATGSAIVLDGIVNVDAGVVTGATSITSVTQVASTSLQTPLIEYTDGDDAMTIADGGAVTFGQEAQFSSGIQTAGSIETATIDYTDGDMAMTIADGGAVTFSQEAQFSSGIQTAGSIETATIDYIDGDLAITIADGGAITTSGDATITGDITITGNTATFGNGETISNSTDGTVLITAPTTSVSGDLTVGTSLQTATIDYTDGDLAITIADGGAITTSGDATITGDLTITGNTATFGNGESISNATNGDFLFTTDIISGALTLKNSNGENGNAAIELVSDNGADVGDGYEVKSLNGNFTITSDNSTNGTYDDTHFTIAGNSDPASSTTTIAGGAIVAGTGGLDISGGIVTLANDETISNATDGTVLIDGIVSGGSGSAQGVFTSNGNQDVIIRTGNTTTGSITITDGADGDMALTPNGTGEVDISKVDIDAGAIDGTVIGANSASTGAFTTVTASTSLDITGSTGLILENDETITNAINGTVLITSPTTSLSGDLTVTGNDISFGNGESISNGTDGTVLITAPTTSVSGDLTVGTSLQTATIDYTDGDLAITILDGGAVTTSGDLTVGGTISGGNITASSLMANDIATGDDNVTITTSSGKYVAVTSGALAPLTLTSGAALNINPATGSAVVLDGTINVDAGVVTNATSITSVTQVASTSLQTPLIEYTDGDDAMTIADGGAVTFAQEAQFSGGVQTAGSIETATIDYTDGDVAMTIADGGAVTFAQEAQFSGGVQTAGSIETATIDYTNGDVAMTIADGGAVTFAQEAQFSGGVQTAGSIETATIDYTDGDLAITIADGGAITTSGNATITGDLTVTGNDIAFGNGETLSNSTDGTVLITSPVTSLSGDLTVTGNDLTFGNGETLSNSTDGTVLITSPVTSLSGDLTVTGNDLTFGNGEAISNSTDGTVTITSPTTSISADLAVAGLAMANANIAVKNGATSAGKINFYEDSNDGTEKLIMLANSMSSDVTLTLPANDGDANQVLRTDGSGVMSWVDVSAANVTITDNENTSETNALVFTSGGDVDGGSLGLESDGDATYNPSTGVISSTGYSGSTIVASTSLDITGSTGLILENDETITNSTDGTVLITSPTTSLSGDFTVTGNDISFGNGETISNATDGTVLITAPTTTVSAALTVTGDLTVTGNDISFGNGEVISNSTDGTVLIDGIVSGGSGSAQGVFTSNGNQDVIIRTGNTTTGSITITDGADGDMALTPNGTGEVDISKVDIDAGAIDGTVIGANSASTGAFTTVTASTSLDITGSTGLILENDETITNSTDGTVLITSPTTSLSGDLTVTGNDISFGNGETISNSTDGTVLITSPTTSLSGDLTVTGNDLAFGNGETISNSTDGTVLITAPTTSLSDNLLILDDKKLILGTDGDISIQYDEDDEDALEFSAEIDTKPMKTLFKADRGDDAGDMWELKVADNGIMTFGNDLNTKGDIVTHLTITPNATVANSSIGIAGDLTVTGNDISFGNGETISNSTDGTVSITSPTTSVSADLIVTGDLTVTGNDIKSSSATAITLSGADAVVAGDLTVTGNDIKSSSATAMTMSGANITTAGTLTSSGLTTANANIVVKNGAATAGYIEFYEDSDSGTEKLKLIASAMDADVALTLPANDGDANQVLRTDGSGVMSWVDVSASNVTITDNENTSETNALVFTAGGDVDGGSLGLESDGDATYNPSTGVISSTGYSGSTIVASTSLDITGSTGLILENDETITNSTDGTVKINGIVSAGTGSADGVFISDGDYDVILRTGNSTTGSITITDGANGDMALTPNGNGEVNISKVDIDAGAIDGTVIGANSASTGAFTTVTASTSLDITGSTGLILENDETITNSTDGTVLITSPTTSLSGDFTVTGNDISFGNGETISNATDGTVLITAPTTTVSAALTVTGDLTVTGNDITFGNGEVISNSTDGTVLIDGIVSGGTGSAQGVFTSNSNQDVILRTGNSTTGSITITDGADGDMALTPNGTGEVDISKVDIDAGAIDGTVIGANSASTGAFTTVTASTSLDITGSTGLILENDETITNSTDGTVLITAPTTTVSAALTVTGDLTVTGNDIKSSSATAMTMSGANITTAGTLTSSGLTTANANIVVKNGATTAGYIEFYEDSDDGTQKLKLIASAMDADVALTLPANDGDANQVLRTDGSGVMSWVDVSASNVTITDNENSSETNALVFTAGGDVDGGSLGLESDGDATYNPSTGVISSTGYSGSTIVASTSLDITGSTGLILENDETITNSTDGTVLITSPTTSLSGDLTVTGNDLAFGNGETISNSTDGTVLITAPTTTVSAALTVTGDLTVTGNDITFGNGETISNATDGDFLFTTATATGALTLKNSNATNGIASIELVSDNAGDDGDGYELKSVNGVFTITSDHSGTGTYDDTYVTVTGNSTPANSTTTIAGDMLINGGQLGLTGDADLITLASGIATVAGEISVTTLDIGGTNVTADAGELNILDGVTSTFTELNYTDITTLGTSQASKAVTVDSNGDLIVPDSDKYKFGAGSDMQLYHDGTNSYITNATGAMKVATETSGIAVTVGHSTSETTIGDNLTVTGDAAVTGDLTVTGNDITFGLGETISNATDGDFLFTTGTVTGALTLKNSNASDGIASIELVSDNAGDDGDGYELKSVNGVFTITSDHSGTGTYDDTYVTVTGNSTPANSTTTIAGDMLINGGQLGLTDDADLITLASGIATVAGEISVTTLDIGGTNVTADAGELNILDGVTSTFTELNYTDITTLGTSQASKAVTVDSNGDLIVPDSDKYKFGAGSDMQLYHDGTNSYITNATGAMKVATETSGIAVTIGHTTSEVTISDNLTATGTITATGGFIGDGSNLTGITASTIGTLTGTNAIAFRDSELNINSSTDGQLDINVDVKLDISAPNTEMSGDLKIAGNDIEFGNSETISNATDGDFLFTTGTATGALTLKNSNASDGIASIELVSDNAGNVGDGYEVKSLNGAFTITSDHSSSGTYDGTYFTIAGNSTPASSLITVAGELSATTLDIGGTNISASAAELNYTDVSTLGTSQASKAVTVDSNGDLIVPDSDKYQFGTGSDMEVYHDGSNSYITNATGAMKVATETSGIAVTIGHTTSETTIGDNLTVTGDAAVTGDLTVTGNDITFGLGETISNATDGDFLFTTATATGALTVKNSNTSDGIASIELVSDNGADVGDGYEVKSLNGAFTITSDHSSSGTYNDTYLTIDGNSSPASSVITVAGELSATTLDIGGTNISASAAEINYNDITTLGTSQASKAVTVNSSGDLIVPDGDKFQFGTGSDMEVYHDGSNSYLTNKTGALKVATGTSGIAVTVGHSTSETTIGDNLTVTGDAAVTGDLTVTGNDITFGLGETISNATDGDFLFTTGTVTGALTLKNSNASDGIASIELVSDNGADVGDGYELKSVNGVFTITSDHSGTGTYDDTYVTVTGNSTPANSTTTIAGDMLINGGQLGLTGDADLITLASGIATVAGEISVTTLDIGGTNVTADAGELNILDGVTSTFTELNYTDITTLGTSQASKAVTVDSNGDLIVPDSDKYTFGAGSDMEAYHDGSNSYITNKTGALKVATETSGIAVTIGHTTSEVTVGDNLTVTGTSTLTGVTTFSNKIIINSSAEDGGNGVAIPLTNHATFIQTGGAETSTLGAGTEGQIKVIVMEATAGDMVTTVTNAAWGGSSIITFDAVGDAVTLQYIDSKWYCIGNNGAVFG